MPKIAKQPPKSLEEKVLEQPIFEGLDIDKAIEVMKAHGFKVEPNGVGEINAAPDLIRSDQNITHNDLPSGRWYHLNGDDDLDNWRPSVTTILQYPNKGPGMDTWYKNYGHLADSMRDAAGIRGTAVHYWIRALVEGSEVTAEQIRAMILDSDDHTWRTTYTTADYFTYTIRRYLESFVAFWKEHKPVIVACEYPIYNKELDYAGRLDLIVRMKKAKNSKKDSLVMMDIKTGRKFDSHALQNSAYAHGWNLEHPDMKIDHIAGLYVTDGYRKDPTYTLHYQKYDYSYFRHILTVWYGSKRDSEGNVGPKLRTQPATTFKL